MIWFFERGDDRLQYEIRREVDGPGYELVVTMPDGTERVERFEDTIAIVERALELQRELLVGGWQALSARQRPPGSLI
jgi:hypothetical protein